MATSSRHSEGLRESVARAVLSGTADAIIATDRAGTIEYWNASAERIFGYPESVAVGQSLDLIIPERLRQRHWEGYRRVMDTGRSRYGEGDLLAVPALREDGTTISVEFTIVPLREADGTILGLAAVVRDVSKRFDELRALRRRITELEAVARRP